MGPVVFKATGLFLFFIFINIITSKSYEELVSKVEELGFKNLKDVIII